MKNLILNILMKLVDKTKSKFKILWLNLSRNGYIKSCLICSEVQYGYGCKFFKANILGKVSVGDRTSIYGPNTQILSKVNSIDIGKYCSIASNVLIIEYAHNLNKVSTYYFNNNIFGGSLFNDLVSKGKIEIGNDVWIGANSVILGGVKVGNGAVIAAGSIVNSNIPAYAIAAGNPARIVKYRFSKDKILELENTQWWDWSSEKILRNKAFFNKEIY